MEHQNFLKARFAEEGETEQINNFFDNLTEQHKVDIFASFGKYDEPDGVAFADLYNYHIYNFYVNDEWSDTNLEKLAAIYKLQEWQIYGKKFYIIRHPNATPEREKIKKLILPIVKDEYGDQTAAIEMTDNSGKKMVIDVPIFEMFELEYILKEVYREQVNIISSGFTFHKEVIGKWLEEQYQTNPQLSDFSVWHLKHKRKKRFDFRLTHKGNNQVDITFNFSKLLKISKTEIKNDLIEYCIYVRDENRQIAKALNASESKLLPLFSTGEEQDVPVPKEINITEDGIEIIRLVLEPHFQASERELLLSLLKGESINNPLNFTKNANKLTDVFWRARKNGAGYIQDTNVILCEWILKNFRYNKNSNLDRVSVTKDLNGQTSRCKNPLPKANIINNR